MYAMKSSDGFIIFFQYQYQISEIPTGSTTKYCSTLEYMPPDAVMDWDNNKITTADETEHTLQACTVIALTASIVGSTLTITRSAACKLYVTGESDRTEWSVGYGYTLLLETSESSSDAVITLDIPWKSIRILRLEQTTVLISNTIHIAGGPSNAYYEPLSFASFSYMNDTQLALRPYRRGQIAYHGSNGRLFLSLNAGSSSDWMDIAKAANNVDFITGTSAPSSAPERVGQIYINTSSGLVYISKGTNNSGDWICLNPSE